MIRRSYLPALALCAAVLGPSSAKTEIISQGSWSATGDSYYSTGMTAQSGAWSGETYSQGMMMADGQFYIQGMALILQGGSSGQNYGDSANSGYNSSTSGGYNSTSGGYSSGIGSSSDTGQPGSNSHGGDPSSDAFTNLTFDASGVGSPGGDGPDDGPLTWAAFDGYTNGDGDNGNNGHNSPPNGHHPVPEPTSLHLLVAAFLGLALNWSARLRHSAIDS
jgi:hypothetical protein